MSEIYHLLYTSRCSSDEVDATVQAIIQHAINRNKEHGITGFLVERQGYFMQLIEGDEQRVLHLFNRIERDPRHTDLFIQAEVRSQERIMPQWSMARVLWDSSQLSSEALIDIFDQGRKGLVYEDREELVAILKRFAENAKVLSSVA